MNRIILVQLILVSAMTVAAGQTKGDVCHVYVVDVAKAKKAAEAFRESGDAKADAKALSVGQIIFPEFRPGIGEEELTTKTYRFPESNLTITASVYYTDESMASVHGRDSMLVGVVVTPQAQKDATSAENGATSEITYNDNVDTVRAKQYLKAKGRLYLVGIECRRKEK
jgi:hypothetical protein